MQLKNNLPQYQKCWRKKCWERGDWWTLETLDQLLCWEHAIKEKKLRGVKIIPIEIVWNYICPNNPKYHRSHVGCNKIYFKGQKHKAFTKPYWPRDDFDIVFGKEDYYQKQLKNNK